MEDKILKTQVFSGEVLFSESSEQPVDVDFSLPDYCPDILKILKCRAVARISAKGMNGRSITAEGTVTINVIYTDSDKRLCAYEYQYPFSKAFEAGSDCDGGELRCRTKCEYINCRAVTSRKIDIHGAAGVTVQVLRRKSTEVLSDVDVDGIELRRGTAPATSPMGSAEKYLLIEEEIEIGQGQPAVRSLIRYDAAAGIRECKLLREKAVVKGELSLTLLYCPEEGTPQTVRAELPFSQLLEIPGAAETCACDAKAAVAYLELKPHPSASGEIRSFMLNAKLLVGCEAYCDNDVAVVLDAYSRRCEAAVARSNVSFQRICRTVNETYHCKKNLEFQDASLAAVTDLWCEVQPGGVRSDENGLSLGGTVTACILAADADGVPAFFEKPIDFEYQIPMQPVPENLRCEPQITVLSAGYTLTGPASLELRVDLCINAAVYETTILSLVTGIDADGKNPLPHNEKSALIVYYAAAEESVWDISRHYNAGTAEVMQLNGLTDDRLAEEKMLLIPVS